MELGTQRVPADWNLNFIIQKAGITNHGGWQLDATTNENVFKFLSTDAEAVIQAIADYPVQYANEVEKPRLKSILVDIRREKETRMTFNGVQITCDVEDRTAVTSAILGMQLPGGPESIRWKLSDGNWATFGLSEMTALGLAMASHVQACFNLEETFTNGIDAAADIHALKQIDLNVGWPA